MPCHSNKIYIFISKEELDIGEDYVDQLIVSKHKCIENEYINLLDDVYI